MKAHRYEQTELRAKCTGCYKIAIHPLTSINSPISSRQVMTLRKTILLIDSIPNSPNYHHMNCMVDIKENYWWDHGSDRVKRQGQFYSLVFFPVSSVNHWSCIALIFFLLLISLVVEKCYEAAKKKNKKYFAIQFYGECWVSDTESYKVHGPSTNCWNGVGRDYDNYVYEVLF